MILSTPVSAVCLSLASNALLRMYFWICGCLRSWGLLYVNERFQVNDATLSFFVFSVFFLQFSPF